MVTTHAAWPSAHWGPTWPHVVEEEDIELFAADILEVVSTTAEEDATPLLSHSAPEVGKLMVCGGVSGALAKTATAPLARLTILYQVGTSYFMG